MNRFYILFSSPMPSVRTCMRQRVRGSTPLSRTVMREYKIPVKRDLSPDLQGLEEAKRQERDYKGKTYQIKIGTAYVTTSNPRKYDVLLHEQEAFERRQKEKKFSSRKRR